MSGYDAPRRGVLSLLLLLFVAFSLGVVLDRAGWLPGNANQQPPGIARTFTPFWQAWHLVQEHYVDRKAINPEHMTEGAILGMLASLGDTGHTTYLTAEELKQMEQGLEGKRFVGIGAQITVREERPTIMLTMPGSPARKAGLKPDDVIASVNDKSTHDMSLQQLTEKIRGPAGTEVKLSILRTGQTKPLQFTIQRAEVKVPEVTWHLLPGAPIAHVALSEFGRNADEQMRAALENAHQAGAKALILDLRGNLGGIKDQAVAVTSEFLPKDDTVFIERDAKGNEKKVLATDNGHAEKIPLCVLIDGGTASSAEILAGAIQDYGRGQLIGTRTFGTGTVLRLYKLSDGSAVLLAVDEWLTPKGRQIWHQGIKPDIEIKVPRGAHILQPEAENDLTVEKFAKTEDKQLHKAYEVLKEQLK